MIPINFNPLEWPLPSREILFENPITSLAKSAIDSALMRASDVRLNLLSKVEVITGAIGSGVSAGASLVSFMVASAWSAVCYLASSVSRAFSFSAPSEIGPKSLDNPGCNCFMNAGLQLILARGQRLTWVRAALTEISQKEEFSYLPIDRANAKWKNHSATLAADWKEQFKVGEGRVATFLNISVKQAANQMLFLLKKWEEEGLSSEDGVNLRVYALILASAERLGSNRIVHKGFNISEEELCIGGFNLATHVQEDGVEFVNNFMSSLHALSPGTLGFEEMRVQTRTVLDDGEYRAEEPSFFTNIQIENGTTDISSSFMKTFVNDFEEGEAQLGTTTEITALPSSLQLSTGLFEGGATGTDKILHSKFRFNGDTPYQVKIQNEIYDLESFMVHSGVSKDSGHYYTYKREKIFGILTWVKYNDGHVGSVRNAEVDRILSGNAGTASPYFLTFSKKTNEMSCG